MKKRGIPFGYRMEMGKLTVHTQEVEVVRWIFKMYCEGISYNNIVDELKIQPIQYDEDKPWNKNIIARMLEDQRYIGKKGYPTVISTRIFAKAKKVREAKRVPAKRTETEKILRQLSGQRRTKCIEAQMLALLNSLIDDPTQIQCPLSKHVQFDIEAELDDELSKMPIDEEKAKMLVFRTAAARYQLIRSKELDTHRLRRIAERAGRMNTLDANIMSSMVESIETNRGKIITLHLKNGQVLTGVN